MLRAEKYKHLVDFLNQSYPMLVDKKYSIGMKIYWFMHGLTDFPKCKECGKPNTTNRCHLEEGYLTDYCSRKCSNGEGKKERMKETFLRNYGVDNPLKVKEIHERQIATVKERYGVENVSLRKEIVEKIANTKEERYGDRNYVNREQATKTNMERYGVDNPFKLSEVQEKCRATMLERYGHEHTMHVQEIRDMIVEKSVRKVIHNSYENYLMMNPYSYPAFTEEFYFNHRGIDMEFDFKCRKCGNIYRSRIKAGSMRRCPKCYPSVSTSTKEQDLFDFLKSVYSENITRKDRTVMKGKELDIFIPEKHLAIEFDGLYWHSELNGIKEKYHLEKTRLCEKVGIRLIHIFEDEWDTKENTVKSKLLEILGIHQKSIKVEDCIFSEPSKDEEMDFLEKNHIQGMLVSTFRYGLSFEGDLIAIMTFSRKRSAFGTSECSEGEFEMLRYCQKNGINVVGGAEALLCKFESEIRPKKLFSITDRRWDDGKVLISLGFSLDHETYPNYWYLSNGCSERYSKYEFQKSVLESKLEMFDPDLSEAENMRRNKFTRIWDCGNLVFVKEYKKTEA